MEIISLNIRNKENQLLAEHTGTGFVDLVYMADYAEGDYIEIIPAKNNIFLRIQVDDVLGSSLVYMTAALRYTVPFGEKRVCYSPSAFLGSIHYLYAETVPAEELTSYCNLALNPNDQHGAVPCFPHASANVETRGESVFAARNAIDGVRANLSHGEWPYQSWGINRRTDAAITIDFGYSVRIDKLLLYTRADFPHDSWWTQVSFHFSEGSVLTKTLEKSILPHEICFSPRVITSLTMDTLIKAEDDSPFPALTQLEVYGTRELLHI